MNKNSSSQLLSRGTICPVGARVVGACVVGAGVVGASVVGASVVGASVVGAKMLGASVVGARVVGASVVGERSVVGVYVDGGRVVGDVVGLRIAGSISKEDDFDTSESFMRNATVAPAAARPKITIIKPIIRRVL